MDGEARQPPAAAAAAAGPGAVVVVQEVRGEVTQRGVQPGQHRRAEAVVAVAAPAHLRHFQEWFLARALR